MTFNKWDAATDYCQKQLATDPDFDIAGYFFRQQLGWTELIKTLRALLGIDIYSAFEIALRHKGWQRWCRHRVTTDPQCAKQARRHIKDHGSDSLINMPGNGDVWFLTPHHFSITLLIKHPTIDPAVITGRLGLTPHMIQPVGQPRVTPTGTPLEGLWRATRWSHIVRYRVTNQFFVPQLTAFVEPLKPHSAFFHELIGSGGTIDVLLSMIDTYHVGDSVPAALLRQMADLGIDFGFESFGVSQNQ